MMGKKMAFQVIMVLCVMLSCLFFSIQIHAMEETQSFVVNGLQFIREMPGGESGYADENSICVSEIIDRDQVEKAYVQNGILSIPTKVKYNNKEYNVVDVRSLDNIPDSVHVLKISDVSFIYPQNVEKLIVENKNLTIACTNDNAVIDRKAFSKLQCIEFHTEKLYMNYCSMMYYPNLTEVIFSKETELVLQGDIFVYNQKLSKVKLPANTTGLEYGPFYQCTNLKKISFLEDSPNYMIKDGCVFTKNEQSDLVFAPSTLKSYILPSNVRGIETRAFANCSKLTKIILNKKLKSIGSEAFFGCKIKSIEIPKTVKEIGTGALQNNSNLKSITVKKGNQLYDSNGQALYAKKDQRLLAAIPVKGICTVPEGIKVVDVSFITDMNKVKKVIFPKSLTSWNDEADYCPNLTYSFKGKKPPKRIEYGRRDDIDFSMLDENGNSISRKETEKRTIILPKKYLKNYQSWLKKEWDYGHPYSVRYKIKLKTY